MRKLAGVADLGLADPHPARIHFTYLDPAYRADSTNRAHDSASVGDAVTLPYRPRIVVISENKDTAINFPHLDRAVSVEGVGKGGGTAAAFEWIRTAETLVYWGDIDADGLEILDGFQAAGLPVRSILMDRPTWDCYAHLGTDTYPDGRRIEARRPAAVPHLTETERELYLNLCSSEWPGFRRLEQERIPLTVALEAVIAVATGDDDRSECN
ncbi:MAG: Wadjet anti-phage system protein JetD domain-containing protein [Phycicoccus sp.]